MKTCTALLFFLLIGFAQPALSNQKIGTVSSQNSMMVWQPVHEQDSENQVSLFDWIEQRPQSEEWGAPQKLPELVEDSRWSRSWMIDFYRLSELSTLQKRLFPPRNDCSLTTLCTAVYAENYKRFKNKRADVVIGVNNAGLLVALFFIGHHEHDPNVLYLSKDIIHPLSKFQLKKVLTLLAQQVPNSNAVVSLVLDGGSVNVVKNFFGGGRNDTFELNGKCLFELSSSTIAAYLNAAERRRCAKLKKLEQL